MIILASLRDGAHEKGRRIELEKFDDVFEQILHPGEELEIVVRDTMVFPRVTGIVSNVIFWACSHHGIAEEAKPLFASHFDRCIFIAPEGMELALRGGDVRVRNTLAAWHSLFDPLGIELVA